MTTVLIWGVVLMATFLSLGFASAGEPSSVDTSVAEELDSGPFRSTVAVVSDILGPVLPLAALVVLAVTTMRSLDRRHNAVTDVLLRGIGLLVACRSVSVFKLVYERQRPTIDPNYPDFSYPSGHVVSVAAVGVTAIVLCAWLAPRLVRATMAASVLLVAVSAACRVLLGLHWLTDVLGAVLGVAGVGLLAAVAFRLLPACPGTVESKGIQA